MIDAQGVIHIVKQARHRVGRDDEAFLDQRLGNCFRRPSGPSETGHGIAGGVMFEQAFDDPDYLGRFFPWGCGLRRNGVCVQQARRCGRAVVDDRE